MKRILYLSEANAEFTDDDIQDLATLSATKNKQLDITGYLCFSRNRFLQYLEGDAPVIIELLDTIRKDERHTFINEIALDNREDRMFSSWSMRYISQEELSRVNLEYYIEHSMLYLRDMIANKQRSLDNIWNQIKTIALIQETKAVLNNMEQSTPYKL